MAVDVIQEPENTSDAWHHAAQVHIDETKDISHCRDVADKLAPVISKQLEEVRSADVGPELSRDVRGAIDKVKRTADEAWSQAARMRVNDDIAKAGRQRRVTETVTEARKQVETLAEQADVQVTVARAQLEMQAIGKPSPQREAFARQDAEATMAGKTDIGTLHKLARDPDPDVRALIAGEWGRRRVEAASPNKQAAAEAHKAIRDIAIDTASKIGTDAQRRAAAGVRSLDGAAKAVVAAREYGRTKLRGFRI